MVKCSVSPAIGEDESQRRECIPNQEEGCIIMTDLSGWRRSSSPGDVGMRIVRHGDDVSSVVYRESFVKRLVGCIGGLADEQ